MSKKKQIDEKDWITTSDFFVVTRHITKEQLLALHHARLNLDRIHKLNN